MSSQKAGEEKAGAQLALSVLLSLLRPPPHKLEPLASRACLHLLLVFV